MPPVHASAPQQSAALAQDSPAILQAHRPSVQSIVPQQSPFDSQICVSVAQHWNGEVVSPPTRRQLAMPQHDPATAWSHVSPTRAQPSSSAHVPRTQMPPSQHSPSSRVQGPPSV
jgi:hypothetical protein